MRGVTVGIVLQCLQGIRHVDEGGYHRASIRGERLGTALLGFVLSGGERAAVQERRREAESDRPHSARLSEELVEPGGLLCILRRKTQLRQPRRLGHPDLGAGGVQALFRREYVWALPHQRGWQGDRQLVGQREIGKRQRWHREVIRRLAAEARERVAVGIALLLEIGKRGPYVLELRLRLKGVAMDDLARVLEMYGQIVLRLELAHE